MLYQCPKCGQQLGWTVPSGVPSEDLEIQCRPLVGGCGWTGYLPVLPSEVEARWKQIDALRAMRN